MKRSLFLIILAVGAAGCGRRDALRPAAGETLPRKPALAATQPTVDQLLTPEPLARPERSEELLRRSEQREDDRFDLPPPGR
ncbi:hypothetical protein ABC347_12520 [Sphingomonas sp. 1P06PA]|uniref:hypothetical protein n=1 Tax=Sphingomonas sp. 1P06PA TaxID=554121 RepID=UPI0039A413A8